MGAASASESRLEGEGLREAANQRGSSGREKCLSSTLLRCQAIGKSSKAPWPNRKKLIVPASTAATTTIFFPAFRTAKGLTLLGAGVGADEENAQGNSRRINDGDVEVLVWPVVLDTVGFSGAMVRRRGAGGGSSGRISKRSFSSVRDGIVVVLALFTRFVSSTLVGLMYSTHFTTTTEKSGAGGEVFLKGVDGLYRL